MKKKSKSNFLVKFSFFFSICLFRFLSSFFRTCQIARIFAVVKAGCYLQASAEGSKDGFCFFFSLFFSSVPLIGLPLSNVSTIIQNELSGWPWGDGGRLHRGPLLCASSSA